MLRRSPLRTVLWVVAVGVLVHGFVRAQDERRVVVGSKNFTENRLLAEIMAQLIEANTELEVGRRIGLGGTMVVFAALRTGQIDLYPEYTGTGWIIHLGLEERVNDPLRAYLRVAADFEQRFDVIWGRPFGFSNSYALAMDERRAKELGIERISDLLEHQADLQAGVSHEFLNRDDGFPGLAEAYGLQVGDVRGMEHGLAYQAIANQRIDLIDTWTTDGKLLRYDIRLLEDDRRFFPPYDAAPIVRAETLDRYPELGPLLDRLGFRIDDARMRALNLRAEESGGDFATVARDFLEEEGLLDPDAGGGPEKRRDRAGRLLPTIIYIGELIGEHLLLTVIAVFLATLTAIPLGVALTRRETLSGLTLGAAGVIQTVPSLALLAFMIPIPGLGLGARSAIAALYLYALLPIIRNTYTGIKEIDPDLLEAATGMGLTDGQVLRRVELPLATRTIMAGVRTSTVISIGVATLAAFIGAGGLGDPIVTGLQLNDTGLVLTGAIPAALLAIVVDLSLGSLERRLVPRGVRE